MCLLHTHNGLVEIIRGVPEYGQYDARVLTPTNPYMSTKVQDKSNSLENVADITPIHGLRVSPKRNFLVVLFRQVKSIFF